MSLPPIDNFMGYNRWLSNFEEVDVELDGVVYPSVEHAYQAAKTRDPKVREWIRSAHVPGEAKKRGRTIRTSKTWEQEKLRVMEDLLRQKFAQQPYHSMLQATRGRKLVEGNWWGDTFWGVCKGEGSNHLGRLIMEIRDNPPKVERKPSQGSLF